MSFRREFLEPAKHETALRIQRQQEDERRLQAQQAADKEALVQLETTINQRLAQNSRYQKITAQLNDPRLLEALKLIWDSWPGDYVNKEASLLDVLFHRDNKHDKKPFNPTIKYPHILVSDPQNNIDRLIDEAIHKGVTISLHEKGEYLGQQSWDGPDVYADRFFELQINDQHIMSNGHSFNTMEDFLNYCADMIVSTDIDSGKCGSARIRT